ncbi:MAG: DUF1993 domain-containing protein [Janthinobacterium lividum]
MTLTVYAASVPVFKQMLAALSANLEKAQTYATVRKIEADALLTARLYPDMLPLTRQIMVACDFAKGASARLAGVEVPKFEDTEKTFEELQARISKTVAFIDSLPASSFEGAETRSITTSAGPNGKTFVGQTYLLHYAIPQFLFHITTAYAILRHNGVEIGKRDFMGKVE